MAKELPFFKFEPAEWMAGRISLEPYDVQGAYISICSLYWQKLSEITERDARLRIGAELLTKLIDKEFIIIDGEFISIKWLDEQLEERQAVSAKRSLAGAKGGKAKAKQVLASAKQNLAEENRIEDKIIEEKSINTPPLLNEVVSYFIDNGYTKESAERAYAYYNASIEDGGRVWKDSKGNTVKNWKQKMRSVWFKEENKVKQQSDTHWSDGTMRGVL